MSCEKYSDQKFDGKLSDVWSLGILLFMMLIGSPPYTNPTLNTPAFNLMISGRTDDVLIHWKRIRLVTEDALDLLNKIFKYEKQRITLAEVLKHKFMQ